MADQQLEPLRNLLDTVLNRLSAVESKVGIVSPPIGTSSSSRSTTTAAETSSSSPALEAYDVHITKTVVPLVEACDAFPPLKDKDVGLNVRRAWDGIRTVVALASKCQKPKGNVQEALTPYLKETQEAISKIRQLRLPREYDTHQRALMEMLASLSWVLILPPPQPPTSYVKDTLGATEFWSNKIRKLHKNSEKPEDLAQITFCDCLKATIVDLTSYTKEYHLSGLLWNNRNGVPFETGASDAVASASASSNAVPPAKAEAKAGGAGGGGGMGALINELASKKTGDGSSAATGLRKVTKDQQTWRKEFKKPDNADAEATTTTATSKPSVVKKISTMAAGGIKKIKDPVLVYEQLGMKWRVEHQTKETCPKGGGHLKIDVKDAKEQIYIYKCNNVTIELLGKLKTITVDDCKRVNVVFGTAVASCEVVNSTNIQLQTLGVCPSFTIDKTDGCLMYLSRETMDITSIVASKSSEMNVSFPDDDGEMKELPIPEQFIHKISKGVVTSEVSDLYH